MLTKKRTCGVLGGFPIRSVRRNSRHRITIAVSVTVLPVMVTCRSKLTVGFLVAEVALEATLWVSNCLPCLFLLDYFAIFKERFLIIYTKNSSICYNYFKKNPLYIIAQRIWSTANCGHCHNTFNLLGRLRT